MRTTDTATFNTAKFSSDVSEMRSRREAVHARGERHYDEYGSLHENVNIHGKFRRSRNAMTREGDVAILTNGIALPFWFGRDGTGSMASNVEKAFYASGVVDTLLVPIRNRYNTQIANAVIQDVVDTHPVFQMTQFESDERQAEQQRLLIPDRHGGDTTEDYDLAVAYAMLGIDADIWRYGLKGHFHIVGDEIGRERVSPDSVEKHLGHKLQSPMSTRDICQLLLGKWHMFYVQVGSGGGARRNDTTAWWEERLDKNRVVIIPDPDRLAEAQAGLVYVTETDQPNEEGFRRFITADGANKRISEPEVHEVWQWLQVAQPHFGAQVRLAGYGDIPLPGSRFAHYRHAWPIGHRRAGENVTPPDEITSSETPAVIKPIDWSKFDAA